MWTFLFGVTFWCATVVDAHTLIPALVVCLAGIFQSTVVWGCACVTAGYVVLGTCVEIWCSFSFFTHSSEIN